MTDRMLYRLTGAAVVAMLIAGGMIFFYAPQDALQGPVQRIFYLHLSSVITAYYCFALVVGGGAWYLWKESLWADRLARAGAQVGIVMTATCIAMGIAWAKPIWNWDPSETWDARFTSTVVLGLVYGGYLLVRKLAPPGRTAMRLAAVVGIIGFLDVPVVYFSVLWWRTLHPGPVIETHALPQAMLLTYLVAQIATGLFGAVLIALRYRIEARGDAREEVAAASPLRLSEELN
jgi:heme exporter protein C